MKTCPQCSAPYPDDYAVCPKDGARLVGSALWNPESVIRGRYKILARLGEGGMATVYRAHHQLLDEPRALKVIKPELARDEQFVQRFKNEAIITRKLQHPNAVRVDDLDIAEDGRPFIAMELVEGESLKALVQRAGPVGVPQTLGIAFQICQALAAAHALGLIHRDIKPDNVFLVPRSGAVPLAKVLDFGIARLKEDTPGPGAGGLTLTGTGVVIGTPDYMSPEQAMGKHGDQLDGRSDLYSLGIVMYRMLTGELPFRADTTVEMILHHIQTQPRPPQALKPDLQIPESVSELVMTALEKNRERRFATAGAMAEAIRQVQAGAEVAPAPPPDEPSTRAPADAPVAAPPKPVPPAAPPAPVPPTPAVKAGAANQEFPRRARQGPPQSAPPQERVAAATPRPAPSKPATIRLAAPTTLQRKGFPTRAVLVGVVGAIVLLLGLLAFKRHRAPSPEAAATPKQQAPVKPALPANRREEPRQGEAQPPANREVKQVIQNAQVFFDAGDYPGAARLARRALNLDPASSAAKQMFVKALQRQGQLFYNHAQYRRAAIEFRRILEVDPNNTAAQESLKQCQIALQDRP